MRTKRKYNYRNSGFSDMRDREEKKKAEVVNTKRNYGVYPWKAYSTL